MHMTRIDTRKIDFGKRKRVLSDFKRIGVVPPQPLSLATNAFTEFGAKTPTAHFSLLVRVVISQTGS